MACQSSLVIGADIPLSDLYHVLLHSLPGSQSFVTFITFISGQEYRAVLFVCVAMPADQTFQLWGGSGTTVKLAVIKKLYPDAKKAPR